MKNLSSCKLKLTNENKFLSFFILSPCWGSLSLVNHNGTWWGTETKKCMRSQRVIGTKKVCWNIHISAPLAKHSGSPTWAFLFKWVSCSAYCSCCLCQVLAVPQCHQMACLLLQQPDDRQRFPRNDTKFVVVLLHSAKQQMPDEGTGTSTAFGCGIVDVVKNGLVKCNPVQGVEVLVLAG